MIKQLTLLDTAMYQETQTFSDWELENQCTDSVTDSKPSNIVVTESKCTSSGCVEIYVTAGTSRCEKKYFRFTWREKNRVKHHHIPGGNIDSISAKKRAALVQVEIDNGRSPGEIVEFIKTFKRNT
jgi:hypothetical protein